MEAPGVSRRQQPLPSLPPPSCRSQSTDPAAGKHPACGCCCGGYAEALARRSLSLSRSVFALFLCLSLLTLALVAGAYRPPLGFFSGIYRGATLQQQQRRPIDAQQKDLESFTHNPLAPSGGSLPPEDASHEVIASETREILNSGASSTPTSSGNSSTDQRRETASAPPPQTSEGSPAKPHIGVAPSSSPRFTGKSSQAQLRSGAVAGPSLPLSGDAYDKLLGGLLATGFDEPSCLSRYHSSSYRRASPYKPSPYLMETLRTYEAMHKRCGPYAHAYNKSLLLLRSGHAGAHSHCKYLVWTPENGLGNRMVSLASAFLYALLADRALLIDRSKDLGALFCEPFPGSTWLLPLDFPMKISSTFNQKHPQSYGNMLRSYNNNTSPPQAFVYAHLSHDYDGNDKRFFCVPDQGLLQRVPWMAMRTDQYFSPGLFLVPSFRRRLGQMFPEKEAVFHHLGRYLFHPSNEVWSLITGYYEANLAGAGERLGIQIRLHAKKAPPFELVTRQILNCTWAQRLLPEPRRTAAHGTPPASKAVLLTSLHSEFLGRLEGVYRGSGAAVTFHQPSHEGRQQTGREGHDAKALAEMYLLSMADELVTSGWSTFGYVAQGLGGVRPWVLLGPVHNSLPEPPCVRAASVEPCFHYPPNYDCGGGGYVDIRRLLPFAKRCRDRKGGIKLVDGKRTD